MDLRFSEHVAIERALRHAVGTNQLVMEYQPVIDLRTGRVASLAGEGAQTPIIDAVLDLARRLHLTTVAEGVETAAQAQLLRNRGCDFAQGYFYSRPVAARHCLKMLQELKRDRPLTQTLLVRAIAVD